MLRAVVSKAVAVTRSTQRIAQHKQLLKCVPAMQIQKNTLYALGATDGQNGYEEAELIEHLNNKDITGFDIRQIVNTAQTIDQIPSANLMGACLRACRKVNDYAMAVRILEALKVKCGDQTNIYNTIIADLRPVLTELGVLTPEEMGYDKPEMYLKDSFDIHE